MLPKTASEVAHMVRSLSAMQEAQGIRTFGQEGPLEKGRTTHSMGHMGPWGHKGWTQLSD